MKHFFSSSAKKIAVALTFTTLSLTPLFAQVTSATQATSFNIDACPTGCGVQVDDLESLSCDMMETKPGASAILPQDILYSIVFSGGVDNANSKTDIAAAYFELNSVGNPIYTELPLRETALGTQQAQYSNVIVHDPDVALGMYYNTGSRILDTVALIVYEYNGEIYLEAWKLNELGTVSPSITSLFTVSVYSCSTVGGCYSGGNIQVSSANNTAKYPRVDIISDHDYPDDFHNLNGHDRAVRYVITWQEHDAINNTDIIKNADGSLFSSPSTTTTIGNSNGTPPDIAGVSNYQIGSITDPDYQEDIVYTTYIDDNGDLMLAERKFNSLTLNSTTTLETSTNNPKYPRIASPVYYDFYTNPYDEAAAVVVANIDSPTAMYTSVNSYSYYDPAHLPTTQPYSVSNYTGHDFFLGNAGNSIMPVVTGTGDYSIAKYNSHYSTPTNDYYSVVFYSDLTWDGITHNITTGNGDLYHSQFDGSAGNYHPVTTNYEEVNETAHTYFAPWALMTPKPLLDAATSTNTNYDIFVVHYDGEKIYGKYTDGASYNFKPTSTGSIVKEAQLSSFPNPAKDHITIKGVNGKADYTLTDITGRVVKSGTISKRTEKVTVSDLANGVYIINLKEGNHKAQFKFVKQ